LDEDTFAIATFPLMLTGLAELLKGDLFGEVPTNIQ